MSRSGKRYNDAWASRTNANEAFSILDGLPTSVRQYFRVDMQSKIVIGFCPHFFTNLLTLESGILSQVSDRMLILIRKILSISIMFKKLETI